MVRAREYAEAFGGGVGGLIEAADAGLLTSAGELLNSGEALKAQVEALGDAQQ